MKGKIIVKKAFIIIPVALLFITGCAKKYTPHILWEIQTKGKTAQVQFTFQNNVIVNAGEYVDYGSPNHFIYSLEAQSGKIIWLFDIGKGVIIQEFSLKNNVIYIETTDNKKILLNAVNGKVLPGGFSSVPERINKNHVFFGNPCFSEGGKIRKNIPRTIFCKDKKTGKTLWSYIVPRINHVYEPDNVDFSFTVLGNKVFIGQYNGKVTCLEIRK